MSNTGSNACCSSRAAVEGFLIAFAISNAMRLTSAGGTLAGTITENAVKAFSGRPTSASVGTSGSNWLLSVIAKATTLPASMKGRTLARSVSMNCSRPASRS